MCILTLICFSEFATEQGLEDAAECREQKNEIIIEGFEDKIKKLEDSLKEKDSLLRSAEDTLAEARSQNEKLSRELDEARTTLEKNSDHFNHESKALNARVEACWGLVLKYYELRISQHKMLNVNALRHSKHYFL